MLLTLKNLTKTVGVKTILKNAQLIIEDQDKIGIIGKNGAGKSTLLKIIAQLEPYDSGEYIQGKKLNIAYLPQMPTYQQDETCYSYIEKRIEKVESYQIKSILTKLGISQHDTPIEQLSGGQKKRVALALSLLLPCDLLILDEPTNHLDQEMIIWLENYLKKYNKALLMVTHDRYFLENVCTKMIELDHCTLTTYLANYSNYLEQKAQHEEALANATYKRKQFLKKELEWVRAGVQARTTKSKSRLQRFEELSKQADYIQSKEINISSIASRIGTKTIEINDLCYNINHRNLIQHFSYQFLRFDRVGIIGKNGVGKSTLLNLITQKIHPTSGSIEIGDTIKIGYFSQEIQGIDENLRVIDLIKQYTNEYTQSNDLPSAKVLLDNFLFDENQYYTYIYKLSGGEKRRLFLLTILLKQPNVLILDEPTNDLDIATLNVLEDFLDNFKGIVITVSHDRYFLDRVVDKVFVFENEGQINIYNGGFSQYFENHQTKKTITKDKVRVENKPTVKMSYFEKKEFETIEHEITNLEIQLENIKNQLNTVIDYETTMQLVNQQDEIELQLFNKMERWQYLSELDEKIKNNKA